jgi:hypothetical protein
MYDRPPGLLGWAFGPRNPMKNCIPLWRTHSCVQRSHSCERFLLRRLCETAASFSPGRQDGGFSTLSGWAFGPRNPMKNSTLSLHRTASVSESDVTFARGCRPLADARGSVCQGRCYRPATVYAGGCFSTLPS